MSGTCSQVQGGSRQGTATWPTGKHVPTEAVPPWTAQHRRSAHRWHRSSSRRPPPSHASATRSCSTRACAVCTCMQMQRSPITRGAHTQQASKPHACAASAGVGTSAAAAPEPTSAGLRAAGAPALAPPLLLLPPPPLPLALPSACAAAASRDTCV